MHLPLPAGLESWRLPSNTLLFRGDGLHVATVDAQDTCSSTWCKSAAISATEIEILSGIGRAGSRDPQSARFDLTGDLVKVREASRASAANASRALPGSGLAVDRSAVR